MTVTELVLNFRACLSGLVPRFESVGIPWKRPDAYDEWDNCVSALFHALVVEPVRATLMEAEGQAFVLPEYDMLLAHYGTLSIIEVAPKPGDDTIRVFHALGTAFLPFDVAEVRIVSRDGLPQSDTLETVPLEGSQFLIRLNVNGVWTRGVEDVDVPTTRL